MYSSRTGNCTRSYYCFNKNVININYSINIVADPGFDLTGVVTLSTGVGRGGWA